MKMTCHDKDCLNPEKDETEFGWKIKRKNIRQSICRTCRANDRINNPEKYRKIDKIEYEKNKEWNKARSSIRRKNQSDQEKQHKKEVTAEWVKDNPDKIISYRFNRIGITKDHYDKLLLDQNGLCASCKRLPLKGGSKTLLVVDHDHNCCPVGKGCPKCVRGLLCNGCNTAAGMLKDSPEAIFSLFEYIFNSWFKRPLAPKEENYNSEMEWHAGL